jgi:hypothetical protein
MRKNGRFSRTNEGDPISGRYPPAAAADTLELQNSVDNYPDDTPKWGPELPYARQEGRVHTRKIEKCRAPTRYIQQTTTVQDKPNVAAGRSVPLSH